MSCLEWSTLPTMPSPCSCNKQHFFSLLCKTFCYFVDVKLHLSFFLLFSFFSGLSHAQVGGNNTYEFLNLVPSARIAATGGNGITLKDNDLNPAFQNPALFNSEMNNRLVFNFANYLADISYGSVGYAKHITKLGTFGAHMQYISYGKFTETTSTSEVSGNFTAGEYALGLAWAKALDSNFSVGVDLKTIYSQLYDYTSVGNAVDLGAVYTKRAKNFTAAFVIKNLGMQLKPYVPGNREKLPFELQAGISKKPLHVPFRLMLVAENLERWNLLYEDSTLKNSIDPLTQQPVKEKKHIVDNALRHLVVGGEFLITKNFNLRFGYNYQRRKELRTEARPGMAGFSFGVGIKVYKFQLSYGWSSYSIAGGASTFSLGVNLADFAPKSKP
jgi:hypothetical protein